MNTNTLIGILFALLALSGCGEEIATTKTQELSTISIGALLPLTGDASAYGLEFQKVADIALQEINAQGGVNGKQLRIIYEDSKCTPKDGTTAAQKLIDVDKVKIILGGACSGETLGAAPIAEAAQVLLLSPGASSPDISNAGDYIFRTNPSDAFSGKVAAEEALNRGYKRAAIIHETTDYAVGIKRVFDETFSKQGEIIAIESYNSDENDMKTQLTKIKSRKPDVVYVVTQSPNKASIILKQMNELGMKNPIIMDAVMIRGTLKDIGNLLEGVVGVEPKFDQNGATAKALFAKYRTLHGTETFGFYDAATYDAVNLIAESLAKYGEDTNAIKNWWYTIKNKPGALGSITFDAKGDLVSKFSVVEIHNGQIQEIRVTS